MPASAAPCRGPREGGLPSTGRAGDGEVEDYALGVVGHDFGDAPDSYDTQGAGAAEHTVDPTAPGGALLLGSCVDTEADGQPDPAAAGDDTTAGTSRVGNCFDDEDGIAFTSLITACQTASLTATASRGGLLHAWIDFNRDGDFTDPGEQGFAR